jgi:hypothetical protein
MQRVRETSHEEGARRFIGNDGAAVLTTAQAADAWSGSSASADEARCLLHVLEVASNLGRGAAPAQLPLLVRTAPFSYAHTAASERARVRAHACATAYRSAVICSRTYSGTVTRAVVVSFRFVRVHRLQAPLSAPLARCVSSCLARRETATCIAALGAIEAHGELAPQMLELMPATLGYRYDPSFVVHATVRSEHTIGSSTRRHLACGHAAHWH